MAKKKLVHFDAPITVVTSFPLGEIINNQDVTRWIAKWALELVVYGITYVPHKSIKSQALADFVVEWTEAHVEPVAADLYRSMYFNGSLMLQGARAGVVLVSPSGNRMRYGLCLNFEGATNNIAKYEALLHGLRTAVTLGVRRLVAS